MISAIPASRVVVDNRSPPACVAAPAADAQPLPYSAYRNCHRA